MNTYYVYLTDVFGGNLNYSWVTKLRVKDIMYTEVINKLQRMIKDLYKAS